MKKRSLDQRDRFIKRASRLLNRDISNDFRVLTSARRLRLFHMAWNKQMVISSQGAIRLRDADEWEAIMPLHAETIRQKVLNTFCPKKD